MTLRMTQEAIESGLRALGLGTGDVVLLHSSLSSFGPVEGGAETLVNAFLAVVGARGTLVVPTFGALGVVTNVVRDHPKAVRSIHPLASVAAIGAQAEVLCRDHWRAETAHGTDTPYARIAALGGYVCLAGVDQDRNTTLHTVEALLEMPYLNDRTRSFTSESGEVTRTWKGFPGPHRDFIGLDRLLREKGILREGLIGRAVVRLMKSQDMIDVCLEAGRRDSAFVLCDNPNCADCVAQRAALRRARLDRESFTLAASSGLAGRYVPEMIENLRAAGIRHVELDLVQGQPVHQLADEQLANAVRALRDAGCDVVALRSSSVPEEIEDLLDSAADNRVGRVVLPLSAAVEEQARLVAERGMRLSVFNNVQGSVMTSGMLHALAQRGMKAALTFNAGHFAQACEKPFLVSLKQRLRTFVDQLDLEDRLFDGTMQPLGCGNAEIKELISILRCSSFDGLMVLTTANRAQGGLRDAAARFVALLDAM